MLPRISSCLLPFPPLVGVVLFWIPLLGCRNPFVPDPNGHISPSNRYVWGDDYIAENWVRDVLYIILGLTILFTTGTFTNLAGTISPMAVLRQVSFESLVRWGSLRVSHTVLYMYL